MLLRINKSVFALAIAASGGLAAAPAAFAQESLAVVAVAPPPGPSPQLAELTLQLRQACAERTTGVLDASTLRARFLGRTTGASLEELDRAYLGALVTYQAGEYQSAINTLRGVVSDLERLPEGPAVYQQWVRANLKLAFVASTLGDAPGERAAMRRILELDPSYAPDPEQFSPGYRRIFDEVRAEVRALPRRRLRVDASGTRARVFVGGREVGETPATIELPPVRVRVGGIAGQLRAPAVTVDLTREDQQVTLDFALAASLRLDAGPGLAVAPSDRARAVVNAGAWLGTDRALAASLASDGEVQFLAGSLYDVHRGALLREGRVRLADGGAADAAVGALASFLLTGRASSLVVSGGHGVAPLPPAAVPAAARGPEPRAPATARGQVWLRRGAWASGALAVLSLGFAIYERSAASSAYGEASALQASGGALRSPADSARFNDALVRGDAANTRAWVALGSAVVFGAAAGVLGWRAAAGGGGGVEVRF